MLTTYNRLAGQSLERLSALSDGVFAVAMTLLVLDLKAPAAEAIHSEHDLGRALILLAPRLLAYLMSFMTLGIFWNGQQSQFNHLERSDRDLTWIHIGFLAAVSLVPFSTALLAELITFRLALLVYWANILLLGVVLFASITRAQRAGLIKADVPPDLIRVQCRRILVYQLLYAFGAALCFWSPAASLIAILLVQLNSAIAPRIAWLERF
ncbi:MAG TPA: TMEM175 family protein [Holophagaceae bacterium]|nr:TMEM175 family protein [Holophagaceae bacterium]